MKPSNTINNKADNKGSDMKSKSFTVGLFIVVGVLAAMIVFTVLQILLFQGDKALALRTNIINIILGAGGMGALLYMGKKITGRLDVLEDIVRPLAKKDYAALAEEKTGEPDIELYGELKKTAGDLKKFAETFRVHTDGSAEIEEFLKPEGGIAPQKKEDLESLLARFGEIESAAEQAVSALDHADSNLSSISASKQEHSQALDEAGVRLTLTTELGNSIAGVLEESGKIAADLTEKINAGDEEAKNACDIIKIAAKDLEKITGLAEVINQISEQTNILSMNAAIESAHAGSAGAGFAVVAEEMRKLAESTKENAGDIQTVLRAITQHIGKALKANEVSSQAFASVTAGIAGFSNTLSAAAADARKSSEAGAETKAILAESSGEAGKITDSSLDTAALKQSFRAAIEHILEISGAAKTELRETGQSILQYQANTEKALERMHEYLKETEELEDMFFTGGEYLPTIPAAAPDNAIKLSFVPAAKAERIAPASDTAVPVPTPPSSPPPESAVPNVAADEGLNNAANTKLGAEFSPGIKVEITDISETEKEVKKETDADNSWRKDVTVKSPPRTVW